MEINYINNITRKEEMFTCKMVHSIILWYNFLIN